MQPRHGTDLKLRLIFLKQRPEEMEEEICILISRFSQRVANSVGKRRLKWENGTGYNHKMGHSAQAAHSFSEHLPMVGVQRESRKHLLREKYNFRLAA